MSRRIEEGINRVFVLEHSFDLIVLGAGSGGLAAAKRAANLGARVAIVEGDRVGGTCVIRGCVPKKLLVYGSQYGEHLKTASNFGVKTSDTKLNAAILLEHVRNEVDRLNQLHIDLLLKAKVKLFKGWGSFSGTNSVVVQGREIGESSLELVGKNILIAVGGRPCRPDIPGASLGWISDDFFLQKSFPEKIVVIGAGFIACEFACILNGLGVKVIQLVRSNKLLKGFDQELSTALQESMQRRGVEIHFEQEIISIEGEIGDLNLRTRKNESIQCGAVIFATGRKPFTENLNLEKAGVRVSQDRINIDSKNKTNIDSIFAVGDVTDRVNLTPVAIEEGRVFADNNFAGKKRLVNYNFIPKAVFSQPEIASVGLTEDQAKETYGEKNIDIFRSIFRPMSNMISISNEKCLLKLVVEKRTTKVLGFHMLGEHSAEIIQMASIPLMMGLTKKDLDQTMALHPTIAEEFVTMK